MMHIGLLDFKHEMKILDVGCGLGLMLMELANQGVECIGLETVKEYANLLTSCGRYFKINSGVEMRAIFHLKTKASMLLCPSRSLNMF